VGAIYEVSNVLGAGFLEKVYERALLKELALRGLAAQSQVGFPVSYKGQCVGEYLADLVVEQRLVVEIKCVDCLYPSDQTTYAGNGFDAEVGG
jgi:GxxExxY protein